MSKFTEIVRASVALTGCGATKENTLALCAAVETLEDQLAEADAVIDWELAPTGGELPKDEHRIIRDARTRHAARKASSQTV